MNQAEFEKQEECYWCESQLTKWEVTRDGNKVCPHCLDEIAGIELQEDCYIFD